MVFEHIESLKNKFTDKYVVVDDSQPDLRRFKGQTGLVRTVNMNGNALVEFDAYLNIGWFGPLTSNVLFDNRDKLDSDMGGVQ